MKRLNTIHDVAVYVVPKYRRILREASKRSGLTGTLVYLRKQHADRGICKFLGNRGDVVVSKPADMALDAVLRASPYRHNGSFWSKCPIEAASKKEALTYLRRRIELLEPYLQSRNPT